MRPTRLALVLIALWLAAGLPACFNDAARVFWLLGGAVLLLLFSALAWITRRSPLPTIKRQLAQSLPLGVWCDVLLDMTADSGASFHGELFDEAPGEFELQGLPTSVALEPGLSVRVIYRARPTQRGERRFGGTQLLLRGPLGLWQRRATVGQPTTVRVYPNFAAVTHYALLAAANRTGQLGIRRRRRRGEGIELHHLREYRVGDAQRQIDWKATSRRRQLISREYQDERDQRVLFLLDCGRQMRALDGELSHFDHCLNAVLLLAYVALRQGDAVGLGTFGGVSRWLDPVAGRASMRRILGAVYDLDTTLDVPDYISAAELLMRRQRRRALVVLITNVRDEASEELLPAVELLRRQHLVLVASLRERAADELIERPIRVADDALAVAAGHEQIAARRAAHDRLVRGAMLLDVTPSQLPAALVNRYLDIKGRGAL